MIRLVRYSAKTHQGPYLQVNEDELDVNILENLFLIIDGIGGTGIGERYAKAIKETVKKSYTRFGETRDSTMPFFYSSKYLIEGNALINSMYYAQNLISKENQNKDLTHKGGASCLGAALAKNVMTFVSSGNCASYLYRGKSLVSICKPDSLKELFSSKPSSSISTSPLSGIGLFKDLHIQVSELKIQKDDLIIMLTDGAYSKITEGELSSVMAHNKLNLNQKINEVFELCNQNNNLDNQTAILLNF